MITKEEKIKADNKLLEKKLKLSKGKIVKK